MEDEDEKKHPETCTATCDAYRVDVRARSKPIQMGNTLVGNEWVRLPTVATFPTGTSHRDAADVLTFTHNYYGAIALATSALSASYLDEIEARIVRYRRTVTYTLDLEETLELPGVIDRMFADADRKRANKEKDLVRTTE
jgi:hypothetical protein